MGTVDVRQLKQQATNILRREREGGECFDVTFRGRVVARLTTVPEPMPAILCWDAEEIAAFWAEDDALAAEIGRAWRSGLGAVEAVQEQRR